jgi:exodeoxyribonuclease V alpha subunit
MSPDPSPAQRVTLEGILDREIFANEERSHVVAEIVTKRGERRVIAGDLGGTSVGDSVVVEGRPVTHPRFGAQIRIESVRWVPPASEEGMRRFLGGGSVEGVGEVLAGRIVDHFGADTMRVLNDEPKRLREVPGLGKKRVGVIAQAWQRARTRNEERAFLAGLGLGSGMSARVQRALGDKAAQRVRDDPFVLAQLVDGIGFRRADEIARRLEVAPDSPQRVRAGLEFALAEFADEGHVFAPRTRLVDAAQRLLSLAPGPVEDALAKLLDEHALVQEPLEGDTAIYLPRLHAAEREVAEELRRRIGPVAKGASVDAARALAWAQPRLGVELTRDQGEALAQLMNERAGVLTGGPGVGKTTIVRALVEIFEKKGLRVALAAPTGRAARRLAEASLRPAATIHRLLEFNPRRGGFLRNRKNPLEKDVVIVDETSMVDLVLMRDLLRAVPLPSRLVLVGDADQLPSVGPGDVLRDLVESRALPVARLTRILRQAEGSTIVRAAHAVLDGVVPEFAPAHGAGDGAGDGAGEGAFFVVRDDPGAAQRAVVELVTRRLPQRFGLDPLRDVQVLTPMNRGPLGVAELNDVLKAALNPAQHVLFGPDVDRAARPPLAPGDRVIQTRNDYDLDVMNGEIGRVVARDGNGDLLVDFEDRNVRFPAAQLGELALAYAITVHKSQGCEFAAVVLVLSMQHFVLLRRNLLYTALTRAKRILVVVGTTRALRTAVEMGERERRASLLARRLRAGTAA